MATIIRQVTAEIHNLAFELVSPVTIMVKGDIFKQIIFVSNADLVRHQNAIVPFAITFDLQGLRPELGLKIDAEIVHISPHLINNGSQAEEQIIIQINVTPEYDILRVTKQFLVHSIDILEDDEPVVTPQVEHSTDRAHTGTLESEDLPANSEGTPSGENGTDSQLADGLFDNQLLADLFSNSNGNADTPAAESNGTQPNNAIDDKAQKAAETHNESTLIESLLQARMPLGSTPTDATLNPGYTPGAEIFTLPDYILILDRKIRQLEDQLRWDIEESLRREIQAELEYELSVRLETEKARLREEMNRIELEKARAKAKQYEEIQRKSILQSIYGYKTRYF